MDRQALLEKKRQRLLELRSRRGDVSPVVEELPKKVDFSVQVDPPKLEAPVPNNIFVADAVTRFNKAVQTDKREDEKDEVEETEETEEIEGIEGRKPGGESSSQIPAQPTESIEVSTSDVVQQTLQENLQEFSIFSDLRLGVKDTNAQVDADTPFHVTQTIADFLGRQPSAFAGTAKHPELLLVSFSPPKLRKKSIVHPLASSPGLAVIFNRKTAEPIPEFFLQCSSPITAIQFDLLNPFRVFAGLENGRLVMWDLAKVQPTQIAVLPTLQTSSVASAETAKRQHIHHVAPILLLHQLHAESSQNSTLLSVCADGVVNVWSPNFFAFPKLGSIKLATSSSRIRDSLRLSSGLVSSVVRHDLDKIHHNNAPEYRFLNSLVMGSRNGPIYKLENSKEKHYVKSALIDQDARGVNCLAELRCSPSLTLLLSAHDDWHLRLWSLVEEKMIVKIPTHTLVTSVHVRPGCWNQFVTVGEKSTTEAGLSVEFWDLDTRLMSSVFTIPVNHNKGTVSFSPDGAELVIGYENGVVDIWKIEESMLQSLKTQRVKRSIDDGIKSYVTGA